MTSQRVETLLVILGEFKIVLRERIAVLDVVHLGHADVVGAFALGDIQPSRVVWTVRRANLVGVEADTQTNTLRTGRAAETKMNRNAVVGMAGDSEHRRDHLH